jgi:hypothetical protein
VGRRLMIQPCFATRCDGCDVYGIGILNLPFSVLPTHSVTVTPFFPSLCSLRLATAGGLLDLVRSQQKSRMITSPQSILMLQNGVVGSQQNHLAHNGNTDPDESAVEMDDPRQMFWALRIIRERSQPAINL